MAALGLITPYILHFKCLKLHFHLILHPFLKKMEWNPVPGTLMACIFFLRSVPLDGACVIVQIQSFAPQAVVSGCLSSFWHQHSDPASCNRRFPLICTRTENTYFFLTWSQYDALECGERLLFKYIFPFKKSSFYNTLANVQIIFKPCIKLDSWNIKMNGFSFYIKQAWSINWKQLF